MPLEHLPGIAVSLSLGTQPRALRLCLPIGESVTFSSGATLSISGRGRVSGWLVAIHLPDAWVSTMSVGSHGGSIAAAREALLKCRFPVKGST